VIIYLCSYCSERLDTSEKLVFHEQLHTFMQEKESFNNLVNVNKKITDNYEIKTDQEDEIKEEIVIETVETIKEDPLTVPEKEENYGYNQSFIVFHEI